MLVQPDNEKFGVWLECPDGSRTHLTTKAMSDLMYDLEIAWLGFFQYGFDGVGKNE